MEKSVPAVEMHELVQTQTVFPKGLRGMGMAVAGQHGWWASVGARSATVFLMCAQNLQVSGCSESCPWGTALLSAKGWDQNWMSTDWGYV